MGPIRNPRWEQKQTEGYVIVSSFCWVLQEEIMKEGECICREYIKGGLSLSFIIVATFSFAIFKHHDKLNIFTSVFKTKSDQVLYHVVNIIYVLLSVADKPPIRTLYIFELIDFAFTEGSQAE